MTPATTSGCDTATEYLEAQQHTYPTAFQLPRPGQRRSAQLENALNAYQGAFVVVSHDEGLLTEIGGDRRIEIVGGRLNRPGD